MKTILAKVKKTGEVIEVCPILGKDGWHYVKPGIKESHEYHPEDLEFIKK